MSSIPLMTQKLAARLADPAAPPARPADWEGAEVAQVVALLRANKVPLVEVQGGLETSSVWNGALELERGERDRLVDELSLVTRALAERGITPVLFKTPGGLPYRSSNVDLLVRPSAMAEAAELLSKLGHLRLPHYREDHKLLFRLFRGGRPAICVHLHEAVNWGKVLILMGDDVVARSRPKPGFSVAGREDLVLITLAHSLYETDQVRLSDLRILKAATRGPELDWRCLIDRAHAMGWSRGLATMLGIVAAVERSVYGVSVVPADVLRQAEATAGPAWWPRVHTRATLRRIPDDAPAPLPFPLSRLWSKAHAASVMIHSRDRARLRRLADLGSTAWNLLANRWRLRTRPAVLVSLSGLDGSGKSTALRALHEAMVLCEVPTRVVWSRGGFSMPAQAAKRAARSLMGEALPGPASGERKRRWLSGPAGGSLFAMAVVGEQGVKYQIAVRAPGWLGLSVLCDRYVLDAVADLEAKLGGGRWLTRAAAGLLLALAPEPDLAILLRLDPLLAAARKPNDVPPGMLVAQAAIFDRLAGQCGMRVIDASRDEAAVCGEVVDLALRTAFASFGGSAR